MKRRVAVGRIRHEHGMVLVPREIRLAIANDYPSGPKLAKVLGVASATAYALLEPGGTVREDVLERARELARRPA